MVSTTVEAASEEAEVAVASVVASIAAQAGAEEAEVEWASLMAHQLDLAAGMEVEVGMAVGEVMTAALVVADVVDVTMPTSSRYHREAEADTGIGTVMVEVVVEAGTRTNPARRDHMMALGMMIRGSGGGTRVRFAKCDYKGKR